MLDGAAYRRSAISRAYYAVYHVASESLFTLGFRIPREHRGHAEVRAYLAQSRVDPIVQVGALLDGLQALRVKADYWLRDPQPEDPGVIATWLGRAAWMIRILDAVAADPAARARMTAAIRTWQQRRGGPR